MFSPPVAALDFGALAPLLTVVVALLAAVFGALRYNRDDASAVVVQQSTVLGDMKALNDQLRAELVRACTERDNLLESAGVAAGRILELNAEITVLRRTINSLENRLGVEGTLTPS